MTIELIRIVEDLKRQQRFDRTISESSPLSRYIEKNELEAVDFDSFVHRFKKVANKQIVRRFRERGLL